MFVKELGKKAGVPSVYTLPFYMLGNGKLGCKKFTPQKNAIELVKEQFGFSGKARSDSVRI